MKNQSEKMLNVPYIIKVYTEKFLKYVDIFGFNQELFVFGERRFKTLFGGMLSMAYFGFALLMFFFLGSSMLDRENPDTTVSQLYNENPSPSKVGKQDYFFMFGMQKWPFDHFYDPAIYTVSITDEKSRDVNFERCTLDHLPVEKNLNDFFQTAHNSEVGNLLCLAKDTDLILEGTFASKDHYRSIYISISPCQNDTKGQNSTTVCKPQAEIDLALGTGNFAFYSVDIIIDLLKQEPGQKVGLDYFIETSTSVRKQISRFLSTSYIREDIGWIIKNMRESSYTVMDHDRESMSLIPPEDQGKKEIVFMHLRKAVYEKIYTRKYMKIQSVLALMGGFLNIIYSLFYILSQPVAEKLYHDDVMNFIYDFEHDNEDPKASNIEKKVVPTNTKTANRKLNFDKIKSTTLANYDKNKNLFARGLSKEKKSLNVSFAEDIRSYFTRNSNILNKTRKRKKAIEKIQKKLDLTFLFEKFEEIEKLKMMLLNEEQYRLFEFLPKPRIQTDYNVNYSPDNKKYKMGVYEKSFHYTEIYDKKHKIKIAEESLEKILAMNHPSEIDMKLISLLSPDLKGVLFEEKE